MIRVLLLGLMMTLSAGAFAKKKSEAQPPPRTAQSICEELGGTWKNGECVITIEAPRMIKKK